MHGDPSFLTLDASLPEASEISHMLDYTGYVALPLPEAAPDRGRGTAEVLVSIGGGAVGDPLISAALAARPLSRLRERQWRILAGHNLPEDRFQHYRARAEAGVTIERARPDFPTLLTRTALSISQGGYNTMVEVLGAGAPAVVVPFSGAGENEQALRASVLAERGLVTVVEEAALDGPALAAGIDLALARHPSRSGPRALPALDGAAKTADHLARMLATVAS